MTNRTISIPTAAPVSSFRCIACGVIRDNVSHDFRCTDCGDLLEIFYPAWHSEQMATNAPGFKALWQQRKTSRRAIDESGVWRFRELLPALRDWDQAVTLCEGNTPLYNLPACARIAGVNQLYAKHQGMNPTGSFKDTGMTVAASFALQEGFRWVACASTGNTSASMAAYAARSAMRSLVVIPEGKVSWAKLSQALDYGALTCELRTDFDGCMRVLNEVVKQWPVCLLNSVNPYRIEGQKTGAIELLEQFDGQVPDHIIVPGGNLGNCSALGKALLELLDLGLITRTPKVSVIQAEGANTLLRSIREHGGKKLIPMQAQTAATAIRIGSPASWKKAVRVLQATGGTVEQASEIEIAQSKAEIGTDGIGCEPASAVTLAGLKKLVKQEFVKQDDIVVLILTGHLLKDPEFTLKFHRGDLFKGTEYEQQAAALRLHQRARVTLEPTADAVVKALEQAEKSTPPN